MRIVSFIAASLFWFAALVEPSQAADIKILSTRAVKTILDKIGPQFEGDTGHRLNVSSDIALNNVRRVMAGEPFDLLIASPRQIDDLVKSGKIRAETRTSLVRSGIGVEVKAGAPKPEIGTLEAFKSALLTAKSVGYLKEGQSGVYLHSLFQRMGIAEALAPKTVRPDTDVVSELVAKGEIELGLVVITQILTTPGVELVGPIPQEIQSYITFVAGISAVRAHRTQRAPCSSF
jgi:molybdate transport system substrate-binding protein